MTNHNERLDEILNSLANSVEWCVNPETLSGATVDRDREGEAVNEAKQALTSLIKELVAEAKPLYYASPDKSEYQDGFNTCIRLYEQNLLKELEEV